MSKSCIIILALFLLTGCGMYERANAKITGHSKVCIDGVLYIQFSSGTSVAYSPQGYIKRCEE